MLSQPASNEFVFPHKFKINGDTPIPILNYIKKRGVIIERRDIKKIFYFNEKENKRFKKNVLKSNLSGSSYLRSLITNYQPKDAPSDTILLPIIDELKSVGKTLNEIARTANRFDFIQDIVIE